MTFLELCQRLRQEVGAAGTGPASVTGQHGEYARLIAWVRQAWQEIQLERREWRFAWSQAAISVETAYRDYSAPADLDHWDDATLRVVGHRLRAMPWHKFRERHLEDSGRDHPSVITLTPDGKLMMDTAPDQDGELTFEYYRTPQLLADNGDVPRMPAQYHMAIVYRAMLAYAFYENASEVAQAARLGEQGITTQMELRELPDMTFAGTLA